MKKILIVTITLILNIGVFAQQDPMFSQYMFNYMIINPAYAGSRDVLSLSSLYRKQWVNVDGAPQSMFFSADMPIKNEKIGVGLMALNDKVGIENSTTVSGMGSYRIRLDNNLLLSFGLSASTNFYKANFTSLESAKTLDPSLSTNTFSKWQFNFGSGVYLNNDRFYVSLSLPHLVNNKRIATDTLTKTKQRRHFFLGAGYVFKVSETWAFKPSFLYKYAQGAPMQLDLNGNFWYANLIGFGLSYRTGDSFVPIVEINPTEQLRIGYAYDYTYNLKKNGLSNGGTHEVFLRYEFGKTDKKIVTPRYF